MQRRMTMTMMTAEVKRMRQTVSEGISGKPLLINTLFYQQLIIGYTHFVQMMHLMMLHLTWISRGWDTILLSEGARAHLGSCCMMQTSMHYGLITDRISHQVVRSFLPFPSTASRTAGELWQTITLAAIFQSQGCLCLTPPQFTANHPWWVCFHHPKRRGMNVLLSRRRVYVYTLYITIDMTL